MCWGRGMYLGDTGTVLEGGAGSGESGWASHACTPSGRLRETIYSMGSWDLGNRVGSQGQVRAGGLAVMTFSSKSFP